MSPECFVMARYLDPAQSGPTAAFATGGGGELNLVIMVMSGSPDVAVQYSADLANWSVLNNKALASGLNVVTVGDVPNGYFRAAFSVSAGTALVGLAEARLLKRDHACGCDDKPVAAKLFPSS